MTSKIIAAVLLGPHETNTLWPTVKSEAEKWADDIVVLNDDTGDAWGNETKYRQELWDKATEACGYDGWLFVLDADFILTFDPHELADLHGMAIAWRFNLYDLWSPTQYRNDQFWSAHNFPRHWMFRPSQGPLLSEWSGAGIHCGHAPKNFLNSQSGIGLAPSRMSILHLGWLTPEIRYEKYERYTQVWSQLSDFQKKHVESVLDDNPNLEELPVEFLPYLECLNESSVEHPQDATPKS